MLRMSVCLSLLSPSLYSTHTLSFLNHTNTHTHNNILRLYNEILDLNFLSFWKLDSVFLVMFHSIVLSTLKIYSHVFFKEIYFHLFPVRHKKKMCGPILLHILLFTLFEILRNIISVLSMFKCSGKSFKVQSLQYEKLTPVLFTIGNLL